MLINTSAVAGPTNSAPVLKTGIEFTNAYSKLKFLTNIRTFLVENHFTYLASPSLALGYNIVLDPKTSNIDKYDFGTTWEPASNCFVGLKHESLNKEHLELGKFFLYFHHNVSLVNTVGTEFALNWQKKTVDARLGLIHRWNDDTTSKLKVNQNGYVDAVLKHRISNATTASLATGFNLKAVIAEQKSKTLPFGLQFDLKF